ncbi:MULTISPECIES: hypothetical protein [unclassified Bilifractor]|uniref:hypothetical protein n=1 Tax=unclassified Bilifractor TaxID=2815795 RepID=UPI003F8ED9AE
MGKTTTGDRRMVTEIGQGVCFQPVTEIGQQEAFVCIRSRRVGSGRFASIRFRRKNYRNEKSGE